jgi:hypothetical protein
MINMAEEVTTMEIDLNFFIKKLYNSKDKDERAKNANVVKALISAYVEYKNAE